jgi:hypothetical protein
VIVGRLVIEYILEGHKRGYNFTSPTSLYDDATLKTIWRNAMPRGRGWNAPQLLGSRSIKGFMVDNGQVAVSEVTVTNMVDESGRRGIRRAVVDVMPSAVFAHHLQSRLDAYPAEVQQAMEEKAAMVSRSFPKLKKRMPLLLAFPFTSTHDWWVMEALVLRLVAAPLKQMRRWGAVIPFTTMALDYRNDSRIIALPFDQAAEGTDVPVVRV